MSRTVHCQYLTFWFAINDEPSSDAPLTLERMKEQDALREKYYSVWSDAIGLIDATQCKHPLRYRQETHSGQELPLEQWEYCDQDPVLEGMDGVEAWPIAFVLYGKAFERPVLGALREMCEVAFAAAGVSAGYPVRLVRAETVTEFRDFGRETLVGI